ncbi:MAG: amidase [Micromonosporaceae bacterium]|nr:amidase [Micromonosporaceae bacterium]
MCGTCGACSPGVQPSAKVGLVSGPTEARPGDPLSPGAMSLAEAVRLVRTARLGPSDRPTPDPAASDCLEIVAAPTRSGGNASPGPGAVARALAAIEKSDQRWRAWTYVDRAGALARAEVAETELAGGRPAGRLEGLPIGVKDVIDVAGMPCTAGFAPFANQVPTGHAPVVDRLVTAGAIVVGKTVTTQFAFSDPAASVNPWNVECTPGGSSSGSAVAVAVGHVPAALGTQTSGSTIRPAAYTGIVGFKPSRGRLPLGGVFPLAWSIDEVGILADTVETCVDVFQVAAGGAVAAATRDARIRVGLVEDAFELATDEVADSVAGLGRILAAGGAELVSVRLGRLADIAAVHQVTMSAEISAVHARGYAEHPTHYRTKIAQAVLAGREVRGRDYLDAQRLRRRLAAEVLAAFSEVDVWLLPSVAGVAPTRETTGDRSLQIPASLLGLPAVSIPSGRSVVGLPIGAQLVAAPRCDELTLAVAARVTRADDWAGRLSSPVSGVAS